MKMKNVEDPQIKEIKKNLLEDPSINAVIPEIINYLYDQLLTMPLKLIGAPNVQELVLDILRNCIFNPQYKIESINKIFNILQKILVDNNFSQECHQPTFIEAKKQASHLLIRIL